MLGECKRGDGTFRKRVQRLRARHARGCSASGLVIRLSGARLWSKHAASDTMMHGEMKIKKEVKEGREKIDM